MTKTVSFLLLSGGVGSRSGHTEPKQFRHINGLEMMAYALQVADRHCAVAEILVNAPAGYHARTLELCRRHVVNVPFKVLDCGETRQESVKILAEHAREDIIILHEAARPLIDAQMLDQLLACTNENAGLFAAIPFSMCEVDPQNELLVRNVPRANVFNIQLPQKFSKSDLRAAHERAANELMSFTEDAVMVKQLLGRPVAVVAGSDVNIKVTTPNDFDIVEYLLNKEHCK